MQTDGVYWLVEFRITPESKHWYVYQGMSIREKTMASIAFDQLKEAGKPVRLRKVESASVITQEHEIRRDS